MNDKFKEIAIETGYLITDQMHPMLEKFAELIIKECASICDRLEGEYLEKSKDEYECYSDLIADGAERCSTEILNYFGTEL